MISTQVPVFGLFAVLGGGCCFPSCLTVANFMLLAAIGFSRNTVTPSGLRWPSRQQRLLGSGMLGAFRVFKARLRALRSFRRFMNIFGLIADRRNHCVPLVPQSLRNVSSRSLRDTSILTAPSEKRVPSKSIGIALSQAPDSLVETAANQVQAAR
ncbi:hypothetical protein ACOME3_002700 [Neoechinorhynchus agilis]